jgi:cyclic 2,3-diphosphoglycerate synthetase
VHDDVAAALREAHGCDVVAVSGALADRAALRRDLDRPEVAAADVYLVEIKAAAIDTVVEAAAARGIHAVACDNELVSERGALDDAVLDLARACVAAHA